MDIKNLSRDTLKAIAELQEMDALPDKYQRYQSFDALAKDVLGNYPPVDKHSSVYMKLRDGLLETIALEHGYDHPEVIKRFKDALHEFNPSLSESKLDFIVRDLLSVTDFSSPSIRKKSLAATAVGFYRTCYLHTGCYTDESIAEIKYKGLIPEPNALESVIAARQELQAQKDIAYMHLDALVDAIVAFSITDVAEVEKILDELSEWCDDGDLRFLELDKKLCRHIYLNYSQLVKGSATMFKLRFMEPDECI